MEDYGASRLKAASELKASNPEEAAKELRAIALGDAPNTAEGIKVKDGAIQELSQVYVQIGDALTLKSLLSDLRPLFAVIPKAKTAKVVKTIIDSIAKIPDSTQLQVRGRGTSLSWFISSHARGE